MGGSHCDGSGIGSNNLTGNGKGAGSGDGGDGDVGDVGLEHTGVTYDES